MGFVRAFSSAVGDNSDLVLLGKWIIAYVILARGMKYFSKTVQLHSIVHCVVASLWTGWVLWRVTEGRLFTLYLYDVMQKLDPAESKMLTITAFHSIGYFVADMVDIFIDYTNKKRQIYVLHHIAAICGLFTIYWGVFIALVGLWMLELGGLVHHIKHAATVYEVSWPLYYLAEVLYHTVYLSTRIFLLIMCTYGFTKIKESKSPCIDVICFMSVFFLVSQNLYWWVLNVKMLLYGKDGGMHKSASQGDVSTSNLGKKVE